MRTLLVALALLAAAHQSASAQATDFVTKDLSGFDGLIDQHWTYRDGAIIGFAPNGLKFNTFLCSKRKYQDFELSFQVWLIGKNPNSGVQIRSEIADKTKFAVRGPQCDMGAIYWGSLYGELFGGMMQAADKDIVAKALKKDDFNDYYIRCEGKHVTIKLNGMTTVDADFPKMPADGIIAFQLHAGPPMMVIYRNIQFKELGVKTAAATPIKQEPAKTPAATKTKTVTKAATPATSPTAPVPTEEVVEAGSERSGILSRLRRIFRR